MRPVCRILATHILLSCKSVSHNSAAVRQRSMAESVGDVVVATAPDRVPGAGSGSIGVKVHAS